VTKPRTRDCVERKKYILRSNDPKLSDISMHDSCRVCCGAGSQAADSETPAASSRSVAVIRVPAIDGCIYLGYFIRFHFYKLLGISFSWTGPQRAAQAARWRLDDQRHVGAHRLRGLSRHGSVTVTLARCRATRLACVVH
jgi:hypothetical protein